MSIFSLGTLSSHLTKNTVILLIIQFIAIISFLSYSSWRNSSAECISCHSNRDKMQSLGYPAFYITQGMVEKQSNHPNVKCHECHLGNGRAKNIDKAHASMLKVIFIDKKGDVLKRNNVFPHDLIPSDNESPLKLLIKAGDEVRNILWHDRNPETLNFDKKIAEKTCGKSGCHSLELKQFLKTTMATNFKQRTMQTWTKPYGPHNCGPSFADLPPNEVLKESNFFFKNTDYINKNLNVSFSHSQATAKQKFCNACHVGCIDCHYTPNKEKGSHAFSKKPKSDTCLGYGRGTTMCHTGSMEMRRGETYIGGYYSEPNGVEPDIHYKKNIHCIDCHQTGEKGMGDIQRKANCQSCHVEIEKAHSKSLHKKLKCSACHINELRGYQITIWGPGIVAGEKNPFKKYSLYYGIQKPPILIKDQMGMWMPVKVWPHSVGNIKDEVKKSEKIMFRWPDDKANDAYYIIGTFDTLKKNNKHLLWLELQQVSHSYGKARKCHSCHEKSKQITSSKWEFFDNQGAKPFNGVYDIVADSKGLRIENLKNTTPIKPIEGYNLEDFASWLFLKNEWKIQGDFSIKTDKIKYNNALIFSRQLENKIKNFDVSSKNLDKKSLKNYKNLKGISLHNEDEASKLIRANSRDLSSFEN